MPPSNEILFVTGHRPNKLGGHKNLIARTALTFIAEAHIKMVNPQKGITGMALGWDTICAFTFLHLEIPFIAAVPFEEQDKIWNNTDRNIYERLLSEAAQVMIVSPGGFASWKFQVRNQWMVNNGTQGMAMWDGSDGGTANCVRYAEQIHKPVTNLWNQYAGR